MWALIESGSITEIYTRPTPITIGDINYPKNIFELWSRAEREAIGLANVLEDNTNLKDKKYYTNTDVTYTVQTDVTINELDYTKVVMASYGTATAKAIADTLYTAQNETDGLGTEGEVKTPGLKTNYKAIINQQASSLLQDTDWMVVRAAEGGTAVPSAITTWRAAVRTKANAMCTAIGNAANVDALAALYVYNDADTPVRPLGEFPILGA